MENRLVRFQELLLTDEAARKAFAANPSQYVKDFGLKGPAKGLPISISLSELEVQADAVRTALAAQHLKLADVVQRDPVALTRFIEELDQPTIEYKKRAPPRGAVFSKVRVREVPAPEREKERGPAVPLA